MRAVSPTPTPTTLPPSASSCSTPTREYQPSRRYNNSHSNPCSAFLSGYAGVNPNNNPVCGKKIKANCAYFFPCSSLSRKDPYMVDFPHRPGQECHHHCDRPLRGLQDHRPRLLPDCVLPDRRSVHRSHQRHDLELGLSLPPTPFGIRAVLPTPSSIIIGFRARSSLSGTYNSSIAHT